MLADAVIHVPPSAFNFLISGFQFFPRAALPPDAPAAKRQQTGPANRTTHGRFGNGRRIGIKLYIIETIETTGTGGTTDFKLDKN